MRRRSLTAYVAGLALLTVAACGAEESPGQPASTTDATDQAAGEPTAEETTPVEPTQPTQPVQEAATEAELSALDFQQLSGPDWTAISADPDLYKSQRYRLFGHITQADSFGNTAGMMLRLEVGPAEATSGFTYPTPAIGVTDFPVDLEGVTTMHHFVFYVEVAGTYNLSSEGGAENAPQLEILHLSRI